MNFLEAELTLESFGTLSDEIHCTELKILTLDDLDMELSVSANIINMLLKLELELNYREAYLSEPHCMILVICKGNKERALYDLKQFQDSGKKIRVEIFEKMLIDLVLINKTDMENELVLPYSPLRQACPFNLGGDNMPLSQLMTPRFAAQEDEVRSTVSITVTERSDEEDKVDALLEDQAEQLDVFMSKDDSSLENPEERVSTPLLAANPNDKSVHLRQIEFLKKLASTQQEFESLSEFNLQVVQKLNEMSYGQWLLFQE